MTHPIFRKLAMSEARRAMFARQALDRFDRHQALLQPAIEAALLAYVDEALPKVKDAIAKHRGADVALTAAAPLPAGGALPGGLGGWLTPHVVDGVVGTLSQLAQSDRFRELLGQHVSPVYSRMLDEILAAGLSDGRIAADLQQWRGHWLEDRTQALLGVPDFVTGIFRTQLRGLAERQGTSVDDAMGMAERLLARGYPSWTGRAELIARTEVVGANNQGALQSWSALSHATGQPATKTWLATPDGRTRKSHKHLDGKTVGIEEDFEVAHGRRMNGPGDNRGGPGEVCNCRCTMTYDFPDAEDQPGGPARNSVAGAEHQAEGLTAAAWTWALADEQLMPAEPEPEPPAPANTGVAIMLGVGAGTEGELLSQGAPEPEAPGLHCTVAYLAEPAASYTPEQKAALCSALAQLGEDGFVGYADAFATAHFNPNSDEREPCAVLLVQSEWLARIHDEVAEALATCLMDQSTTFPVWIPHVAVAYGMSPDEVIPPGVVGEQIEFNRLVVGWGDEQLVVAGDGAMDPTVDTAPEQLTAAGEDEPVTAPAPTTTPTPDEATGGDTAAPGVPDLTPHGQQWEGVIAVLDAPSGDGRIIASAGLRIRPLPLPLSWQRENGEMHDDSVVVGRVLAVEQRPDPELGTVLWATGDYLDPMLNYDAEQAMAQVEQGLGLCSVDLAVTEVGFADEAGLPVDPGLLNPDQALYEVAAETAFGGVTITSFPSFENARIHNLPLDIEGTPMEAAMPGPVGKSTFAAATPEPPQVSDDGTTITLSDGSTAVVGDRVGIPDYDGDGDQEAGVIVSIDATAGTVTVTPDLDPDDNGVQDPDQTFPIAQLVPAGPAVPTTVTAAADTPYEPQPYQADPDETVTCPNCGKLDSPDAVYCDQCGFKLEGATGVTVAGEDAGAPMMASLLASSEVRPYSAAYFKRAEPDEVVPLTVVPETGEVYGHLATWGECHVGKMAQEGRCVTAPQSMTGYADFHLAPVLTDEGPLDVGKLTVGTGHALPGGSFANAVSHYDNTGTAVAVARAQDGKHGIWVCGQIIHDTPAPKIEELMRSPLSGDWRMRQLPNGKRNLELCAALAVNVPGFPVRRPQVRVGQSPKVGQLSLVAAGAIMPDQGRTLDAIGLPSGMSIPRSDFEALVAAAAEVVSRKASSSNGDTDEALSLRLRTARARLALA